MLTLSRAGGGHIVPTHFWNAHCAKFLIHNISYFWVTFSFFLCGQDAYIQFWVKNPTVTSSGGGLKPFFGHFVKNPKVHILTHKPSNVMISKCNKGGSFSYW